MEKIFLRTGDIVKKIAIREVKDSEFTIEDEEGIYRVELKRLGDSPRLYSLLIDGKPYIVSIEKSKNGVKVGYKGRNINFEILENIPDTKKDTLITDANRALECIVSPMSGFVAAINIKVGQQVKKGQELLAIEAMKMRNEIISPVDGVIKEVYVDVGNTVEFGDNLVAIKRE